MPDELKEKFEIIVRESVDSTNQYAKKLAEDGKRRAVIVALEQTAGKGRKNKKWFSPRGGLWFSVIMKPKKGQPHTFAMIAALSVCRLLKTHGIECNLKWPNDVLVEGKKISGILSEASHGDSLEYVIIGIGINCNILKDDFPEDIRDEMTSTFEILNKDMELVVLLSDILLDFDSLCNEFYKNGFDKIRDEWISNSHMFGKQIEVKAENKWKKCKAKGLTDQGFLIIENGKEEIVTQAQVRI